jgi:hypothetical protein
MPVSMLPGRCEAVLGVAALRRAPTPSCLKENEVSVMAQDRAGSDGAYYQLLMRSWGVLTRPFPDGNLQVGILWGVRGGTF